MIIFKCQTLINTPQDQINWTIILKIYTLDFSYHLYLRHQAILYLINDIMIIVYPLVIFLVK